MDTPSSDHDLLLEMTRVGNLLRVAAVDAKTLVEVTFQAPLNADRTMLTALARQKLAFVAKRGQAIG